MIRQIFALWLIAAFQASHQPKPQSPMDLLVAKMNDHEVQRIEIIRIPDTSSTIVAVTPSYIRENANYRLVLDESFDARMASILVGGSTDRPESKLDLRWGLLFFDKKGRELGSVFVDHFGENGFVGNESVKFSTNMSQKLTNFVHKLP